MRAVPVTPRQVMFTVCGQCPSLHAEGLKKPRSLKHDGFPSFPLFMCFSPETTITETKVAVETKTFLFFKEKNPLDT